MQWHKAAVSCLAQQHRRTRHARLPLFHNSTEQGAIAKSSLALHCCLVTAHLYQQQISLGVFAESQACCQLVLHSSTEQGAIAKSSVALHCCWVTAHLY